MIKVTGQIRFTLDFEVEMNMSEEEWDELNDREKMEHVTGVLDRDEYNNMDLDDIETWDVERLEQKA